MGRDPRSRKLGGEAGLTLLELVLAVGVLIVVSLGTMLQMLNSQNLAHESDHKRIARQAAENELERIHGLDFKTIGTAVAGRTFVVPGLPPRAGGAPHALVTVFLDENDADNPGLPTGQSGIDLNGDGDTDDDLSALQTYRMVPIRIEITYPTRARDQREFTFALTGVITPRTFFED